MGEQSDASETERSPVTFRLYGEYLSADDRCAVGEALCDDVPRELHGIWIAPVDRRDPIAILNESNEGRLPSLLPIRFGRMAQSPLCFYRGAAAIMAADLASTPQSGLRVQACGDAHLLNFGGFVTDDRTIVFDISDLDETLPAPWEWDVKRLAASIVIAGRHLGFAERDAVTAAIEATCSYRERMHDYASRRFLEVWHDTIDIARMMNEASELPSTDPELIDRRLYQERKRNTPEIVFPTLSDDYGKSPSIKDNPPLIFHPTEEQAPGLKTGYTDQIVRYRASLPEHVRAVLDRYQLRDVVFKLVGVGSVGAYCAIGLFMAADDDPIFLQVKEAGASVLEPYAGKSLHKNNGERIVAGQRLVQSASDMFLGWSRGANDKDHYVRQLRSAKVTAMIEGWGLSHLQAYGKLCGWALARAHARSGDAVAIAGYLGHSSTFDDAVGEFAIDYAGQNERDYQVFLAAIREGRIDVVIED
jgi:uncharacterized protein (DUF2252 family)